MKRHHRIVSARAGENRIIVMVPSDFNAAAGKQWVNEIIARVRKKVGNNPDNPDLERRTRLLSRMVLKDRPRFELVKRVKNMSRRWASVTDGIDSPGRIHISRRLANVPGYVLGDVIVHELVHTFVDGGYTKEFWYWAVKAPYRERVRGYLKAYQRWGIQS